MGLFNNEAEERQKRWAAEARQRAAEADESAAYQNRLATEAIHEAYQRGQELRARERMEAKRECAKLVEEAKELVKTGAGDVIIGLIQLYDGFDNNEIKPDAIRELINGYTPPQDKEGIQLFFDTLYIHERYIKDFEKNHTDDGHPDQTEFPNLWKSLQRKGDVAWDRAFQDEKYIMSAEEEIALEDIRKIKNSSGVEVLQRMIQYYDRFSTPFIHGSHKGKDKSPAADEAVTYLCNHNAPTNFSELEEYTNYVLNNKGEFDELQERHGLRITGYGYTNDYNYTHGQIGRSIRNDSMTLHKCLLSKVDKAIKTGNHKKVTTGAIGKRNETNRKKRIGCIIASAVAFAIFVLFIFS